MVVFTDQIITSVKKYPLLYDPHHPDYKSKKPRHDVWTRLSEELKESKNELKKKWKNIRDCYKKYLRSITPGAPQALRSYKNWQWADTMEFCKPYILMEPDVNNRQDQDISNQYQENDCQIIDENDDEFSENTTPVNVEENQRIPKVKHNFESTSANKIINLFQPNKEQGTNTVNGLDATDLIFLGYSNIVKSFTPTKQAIVKMKIAQIIMEEELQHAEGISFQSHVICKPSTSGTVNNTTTEFSATRPQVSDPLTVEPPSQRRGRKRKVNSLTEDVCTSSFETNSVNEDFFEVKSEVKSETTDILLDSD